MPYPKDKKGLTIKQKKFVKEYVANDGNGKQAYKAAYGVTNDNTAAAEASTTLSKPNVKEAIDAALEKADITIDAAVQPIKDGLVATRTFGTGDGDAYEAIDHSIRLKASGMALKLLGAEQRQPEGNTYNFTQVNNDMRGKYAD